jgi:hypothetical protein
MAGSGDMTSAAPHWALSFFLDEFIVVPFDKRVEGNDRPQAGGYRWVGPLSGYWCWRWRFWVRS